MWKEIDFLGEFFNLFVKWVVDEHIFLTPFAIMPAHKDAVRKS